jgi:formate dehydrogenase subunit gamma
MQSSSDALVVEQAIADNRDLAGPLMPILHAIQDRLGWIPPAAHAAVAEALNLSRADVHGVVTFYHDFRSTPPGRHVLEICRAEACQSMGSEALEAHLRERTGLSHGETAKDGSLTLKAVYCLGNCAVAPSVTFDRRLVGRVTKTSLDSLLEKAK